MTCHPRRSSLWNMLVTWVGILTGCSCEPSIWADKMDAREVLQLSARSSEAEAVGLREWLGRHPASTRFRLRGKRIDRGQEEGLLLAKIEPHPPRWKQDRWPLGAVLSLEDDQVANQDLASAPKHLRGRVEFGRQRRHIQGRVEAVGHDWHFLAFWLGTSAADVESLTAMCNGRPLRFVRTAGLWATSIPDPPCDVLITYKVAVESAGFDHWDERSLVLSRRSFLPGPVIVGSGTQVDLLLRGMDDWVVRTTGGEHRSEGGWHVSGTADDLTFIAAQSEWVRTTPKQAQGLRTLIA